MSTLTFNPNESAVRLRREVLKSAGWTLIARRSRHVSLWRVFHRGNWLMVEYDELRREVLDVMPDTPPAA